MRYFERNHYLFCHINRLFDDEWTTLKSDLTSEFLKMRQETFTDRLMSLVSESKSERAFAREVGISYGALRGLVAGGSPTLETLIAIAEGKNVSIQWLAKGDAPRALNVEVDQTAEIPAVDPELLGRVVDQIAHVYREEQVLLQDIELGRLTAAYYAELLDFSDDRRNVWHSSRSLGCASARRFALPKPIPPTSNTGSPARNCGRGTIRFLITVTVYNSNFIQGRPTSLQRGGQWTWTRIPQKLWEVFIIACLVAAQMSFVKDVKANHAEIFYLIIVEYMIFAMCFVSDDDRLILMVLVAWGFVSVVTVITIIGADIRDALRALSPPPTVRPRPEPAPTSEAAK